LNDRRLINNFLFYRVGLLAPRPTPIPEDQTSVFISPREIQPDFEEEAKAYAGLWSQGKKK
jgi:hypothetical protein